MYSERIVQALAKIGGAPGDKIAVTKDGERTEGLLMPRSSLGDRECVVLKLRSGYNIGIDFEGAKAELVEKGKPVAFVPAKGVMTVEKGLPNISILGCGGTIASRVDYKVGAVFPAFSPEDLLITCPELKGMANFRGRQLFSLWSEDFTPEHWRIIAREVAKEIEAGSDGVILMHGTDMIGYTAAALSFMLQNLPVPVVIVGAQRSSDRGSSDNVMNLVCATIAAKSDIAEVTVCMHGSSNDDYCFVHPGTKVRKMHTSRRDAFKTVNALPFAKVHYAERRIELLRTDYRKRDKGRKLALDDRMNENVTLLQTHIGMKPEFLEKAAEMHDGIVLASGGLGQIPTNPRGEKMCRPLLPTVKKLVARGIPVVIAPQTIYGRINLNVYNAGVLTKESGVIGDYCDWLPETALVKLMWVLGRVKGKDMAKVKELMETNIAGEISDRSVVLD